MTPDELAILRSLELGQGPDSYHALLMREISALHARIDAELAQGG